VESIPEKLDLALVRRLRRVVAGEVATESELRTLADEADDLVRATEAHLHGAEARLTELNTNPATPLTAIAAEVRRVEALSRKLSEARRLVDGLERRTRELRTAWLKHHADLGSPFGPTSSSESGVRGRRS
jgi:predicted RNase H-like nuclease (RuvC/YqgF family)